MAPNIRIPANFGKKHLNSPVHGNLLLKLRHGEEIRTNSMIMSLNSPVIDRLTSELHQSTLEMEDFTKLAVDCFVESMYTGEVESLQKQIFEDVNKMAHVFEVSWLSKRCFKFYKSDVLNFENNSYKEILFACEIASRAHYNLKQSRYVGCFVENLMSRDISQTVFLRRYMADFAQLSKRQLEMSLAVAGKGSFDIIMILISHITSALKSKQLDNNSLFLLKNLNISSFRQNHPADHKDLADLMLEISEVSDSVEVKEVVKLFAEHKSDTKAEASPSKYVVDRYEESDDDDINVGGFLDIATQTGEGTERGWTQAVFLTKYPLISWNTIQLITTDKVGGWIRVWYGSHGKNEIKSFGIRCEDDTSGRWSYFIENCNAVFWNSQYLTNVPCVKVKHWIITKISTHLKIVCNKVIVLNFNFATDCDSDRTTGKDVWSRKSDFCQLNWRVLESVLILN